MKNKKRKKRPNKGTKAYLLWRVQQLKRECLSLWSKIVRKQVGGRCVFCGTTEYLNAHHIEDRKMFPALAFDTRNGLCCCARHHKFAADSVHRSFCFLYEYMVKNRPEDIKYLQAHRLDKVDFSIAYLEQKVKELKESLV
jgi:hypothetical protein